jgi:hypothetical protein
MADPFALLASGPTLTSERRPADLFRNSFRIDLNDLRIVLAAKRRHRALPNMGRAAAPRGQ